MSILLAISILEILEVGLKEEMEYCDMFKYGNVLR
jgi:hypothetical protein